MRAIWSARLSPCCAAVAALLMCGCGGQDNELKDAGLAGAGGADAGGPGSACSLHCAPEESLDADACACTSDGVRMRLSSLKDGFYAQPWPLATRLRDDGTLDLDDFPTASNASFVNDNLDTIASHTHGFSTNGAIFTSFDGALDADSLPTVEGSLEQDASAYLVEVEPDSATRGERTPLACSYRDGKSDYNPPHFLACMPFAGFPLRPDTTYALVLTDGLLDAKGVPVRASQRLRDVLRGRDDGDDALAADLIDAYAPLADYLLGEGDDLERVVGATVFRTQDPTKQLRALADDVHAQPAPTYTNLALYTGTLPSESGNYVALDGTYDTPIYQQGETPYALSGGDIRFSADGTPVRASTLSLRFALTVPDGPMPSDGYPVVLYHHGTGGDAYSFIDDGTAYHFADAGVAAIGIDAPVHGTRKPDGVDPQLLFFNINNVLALRDNVRQGAVDLLVLERFVQAFHVSAADSPTGQAIAFDPNRIFAMGHSQGGLTVPLMLPFSERVKGAMLSGAGASITASILYKTTPLNIPALARGILGLGPSDTLDAYHPVLSLVQAFSDVADSSNYVPYLYRWPGGRGLDVWATQGLLDTEAPPPVTDALVTAMALDPVDPQPRPVQGLGLRHAQTRSAPVRGNVKGVDGQRYTAVYTQYPDDDHFLIMEDPVAEEQLTHWFQTLAADGQAELIVP